MLLTPTEMERLTIFSAAELARKRKSRGLKLNYPESVALICDEILGGARDGRSVAEMMAFGSQILGEKDVMPGVSSMLPMLQVEGTFADGTKDDINSPTATSRLDSTVIIGSNRLIILWTSIAPTKPIRTAAAVMFEMH